MRCPACRKEFHHQADELKMYFFAEEKSDDTNAFQFGIQLCPSCYEPIVVYQEGYCNEHAIDYSLRNVTFSKIAYPHTIDSRLPDEVPEDYQADYEEAITIIEYSPKASAALSRRLLQKVLREKMSIKRKDLSLEIDELADSTAKCITQSG